MTDNAKIVKKLTQLAQLDIDAVHAYEEALERIDAHDIYKEIASFRDDHLRHIQELNQLIAQYGGTPLEKTQDFKGYIIEGITILRSVTGTKGALNAMETNEKTTNRNYKKATEEAGDMPLEVRQLLEKNYADEQRHLAYIQQTLAAMKAHA